ncbi:uncharacterized protein [Typha angustifolia]|uniref:uncharacterized protein n=1 Tax=Typha angustifolia TaxID=59011 RepID=UPI003C2EED92
MSGLQSLVSLDLSNNELYDEIPPTLSAFNSFELLLAAGSSAPKSIHEVIAQLACRLTRWDDRLFRKYVLGGADEIELKFVNRRNHEDLNLLCIIFNQEIRRLATQFFSLIGY